MNPETDLTLSTTEELLAEVEARFDAFALIGMLKVDQRDKGCSCARVWFNGGFFTCLGLATQLQDDFLTRKVSESSEDK